MWSVPVWQADLDACGELRTTSLLRLLQETATRAAADAGFDGRYYERAGIMWIIRRTRIVLARPARYGDVLTARTWIADFRRVRSQREYEVRAGDALVARASTDWVLVDAATAKPRRIPTEWETTFFPSGTPTIERTSFPEATPAPQATTCERRVELHELDALRHVNNANYVAYLEQAFFDVSGAGGWDLDAQLAAGGRLRAVYHDLEYLDAALYGERLGVTVWTTDVTEEEVETHVHLHRGDATHPLLHARSRYRWTSADGEAAMPSALRAVFRAP